MLDRIFNTCSRASSSRFTTPLRRGRRPQLTYVRKIHFPQIRNLFSQNWSLNFPKNETEILPNGKMCFTNLEIGVWIYPPKGNGSLPPPTKKTHGKPCFTVKEIGFFIFSKGNGISPNTENDFSLFWKLEFGFTPKRN